MYVFICLHCLLPEAATGVEVFLRKGVLKTSVNLTGNYLCWSLFLINLQVWHLFWRTSYNDCFCTALAPLAVTYPFYFIFSLFVYIRVMFVFRSNSEGFKEFESDISFLLSHFHRFYFLFPCFLPFSVLFHFSWHC